jgi:hypothetical protein
MFKVEDYQGFGKEGYEALVASATTMTKAYQAIAQEVADFSRKSIEKNTDIATKAFAAKSFDKVVEVQQGFARESYDALVGEVTKINDMYVAAAKEAYKPFEASVSAFGVKWPLPTVTK